jgi:hypothetical protein
MVGIKALFSFLGILLGLVTGLQWGVPRGWLVAMGTTAGGAVGGGIGGCLFGWLLESSSEFARRLTDKLSAKHPMLGELFRWFALALIVAAMLWLGCLLLRALPRHHK